MNFYLNMIDFKPFTELDRSSGGKVDNEFAVRDQNVHDPNAVFTKAGIIEFKKPKGKKGKRSRKSSTHEETSVIAHDEYLQDKTMTNMFTNLPFFKYFRLYKQIQLWRRYTRRQKFCKRTSALRQNYVLNKSLFCSKAMVMNMILHRIESLVYLAFHPKNVFCFHGEDNFKAIHDRLIKNTNTELRAVCNELLELLKQTKIDHAALIDKTQKEIDDNISESIMYKNQHAKEHVSKANYNQKYRDQKQIEVKSLTAHIQNFYRILQLAVITNINKVILLNELNFTKVKMVRYTHAHHVK